MPFVRQIRTNAVVRVVHVVVVDVAIVVHVARVVAVIVVRRAQPPVAIMRKRLASDDDGSNSLALLQRLGGDPSQIAGNPALQKPQTSTERLRDELILLERDAFEPISHLTDIIKKPQLGLGFLLLLKPSILSEPNVISLIKERDDIKAEVIHPFNKRVSVFPRALLSNMEHILIEPLAFIDHLKFRRRSAHKDILNPFDTNNMSFIAIKCIPPLF
jgi:hypothetical protein